MNEQLKIKRKVDKLKEKIDNAYKEIKEVQATCQHPNADKKYCGSTGNYDPSNDSYWIDFHCQDCNKRWSTPQ